MRVDVPIVKIGGRKITPYAISFANGGSTQPSTLSVKYVNRSGRYTWPDLTSQSLVSVKIGNVYTFNGYPVTAEMQEDSSGKSISVLYQDESIILDQCFVGLKGVHGAGFKTEVLTGSNYIKTILVGEQVDPCKDLEETHNDPCAPPSTSDSAAEDNTKKQIDCAEQRLIKILDVVYSFRELLDKARSIAGIKFNNIPTEKADYFARHTGSLREVLNAWCQEYGITFYWENGIHFVDLKKGIEINDSIANTPLKIIDKRQIKSIAGNYAQANINYFGLDGQIKEYDSKLNGGTRLTLLPITLSDIFRDQTTGALNAFIQKYYGSIEVLQKCCILSKYSPKFRDLYLLYKHYEVLQRSDAEKKNMPLLGLEILNTYTNQGVDQGFIAVFLRELIPLLVGPETPTHFAARCYYNEEVHEKFIEMEKYLANEFIGKYWIRSFNKRGYNFSAPGASVEFIANPTAANFDFANKIPKTVLTANKFLQNLFDVSNTNGTTSNFFRGGMILVQRQSPWQPEGSEIQFVSTDQTLEKEHFNNINDIVPDVPSADIGGVWPEKYSFQPKGDRQPVLKIFSNYFGGLNLEGISTGDHPLESGNVNIPVTLGDFNSVYGLVSSVCKAYRLTLGKNKIFIYMPVQSHDTYGNRFPGFIVTAEKNGSMDYKILVEKIQRVMANFPVNSSELKNSVGLRVNFRDATQYINKILVANATTCQYDEEGIETLLRNFSSKFVYPAQVVQQRISYSIGGVPDSEISLADGLSSFSITLDGNGGMISEIEFSNIPKTTVSDNIRIKDFERIANANYNKSFFSSDNKEILS